MKTMYYFLFLIVLWSSCTPPGSDAGDSKESVENTKKTSDALKYFPAIYEGYTVLAICDSVHLVLDLRPHQEYVLTKEFKRLHTTNKDSIDYENGLWQIEGENIIALTADSTDIYFNKFKIISKDYLQLVDSNGAVLLNDRENMLHVIKEEGKL